MKRALQVDQVVSLAVIVSDCARRIMPEASCALGGQGLLLRRAKDNLTE